MTMYLNDVALSKLVWSGIRHENTFNYSKLEISNPLHWLLLIPHEEQVLSGGLGRAGAVLFESLPQGCNQRLGPSVVPRPHRLGSRFKDLAISLSFYILHIYRRGSY